MHAVQATPPDGRVFEGFTTKAEYNKLVLSNLSEPTPSFCDFELACEALKHLHNLSPPAVELRVVETVMRSVPSGNVDVIFQRKVELFEILVEDDVINGKTPSGSIPLSDNAVLSLLSTLSVKFTVGGFDPYVHVLKRLSSIRQYRTNDKLGRCVPPDSRCYEIAVRSSRDREIDMAGCETIYSMYLEQLSNWKGEISDLEVSIVPLLFYGDGR